MLSCVWGLLRDEVTGIMWSFLFIVALAFVLVPCLVCGRGGGNGTALMEKPSQDKFRSKVMIEEFEKPLVEESVGTGSAVTVPCRREQMGRLTCFPHASLTAFLMAEPGQRPEQKADTP